MYASAFPGSGLMRLRSHRDGPKMNLALLGWLRPVLARKGMMAVRLRPSGPIARSSKSRIFPKLDRSSRSSDTIGYAFAMERKVPSSMSSWPVGRRGHGMLLAMSQAANLSRLKVVPS